MYFLAKIWGVSYQVSQNGVKPCHYWAGASQKIHKLPLKKTESVQNHYKNFGQKRVFCSQSKGFLFANPGFFIRKVRVFYSAFFFQSPHKYWLREGWYFAILLILLILLKGKPALLAWQALL